jgi:hypothetical protein
MRGGEFLYMGAEISVKIPVVKIVSIDTPQFIRIDRRDARAGTACVNG